MRGVGRDGFAYDGGKLETSSAMDRKPMKLSEKRLRVGLAIRLEDDSGKKVPNALKFIDDIYSWVHREEQIWRSSDENFEK